MWKGRKKGGSEKETERERKGKEKREEDRGKIARGEEERSMGGLETKRDAKRKKNVNELINK